MNIFKPTIPKIVAVIVIYAFEIISVWVRALIFMKVVPEESGVAGYAYEKIQAVSQANLFPTDNIAFVVHILVLYIAVCLVAYVFGKART